MTLISPQPGSDNVNFKGQPEQSRDSSQPSNLGSLARRSKTNPSSSSPQLAQGASGSHGFLYRCTIGLIVRAINWVFGSKDQPNVENPPKPPESLSVSKTISDGRGPLLPHSSEAADLAAAIAASLADQAQPASGVSVHVPSRPLSDAASDEDFAKLLAESAAADAGKNLADARQRAQFSTAIANSLPVYGLTLQKAKDDGDCFYHAICNQLKSKSYPDPATLRSRFQSFVATFLEDPENYIQGDSLWKTGFGEGGDALADLKTALVYGTISKSANESEGTIGWAPMEYAPLMAAFLQRPVLVFSPQDRDEKGQLIPVRYMVNDTGKVYLPDTSTKEKEAALFADTSIPDNALILVYNGTNHWDAASRDLAP